MMTMAVVDGDKRRRKEGNLKETLWRIRDRIKEPSNGTLQKKDGNNLIKISFH